MSSDRPLSEAEAPAEQVSASSAAIPTAGETPAESNDAGTASAARSDAPQDAPTASSEPTSAPEPATTSETPASGEAPAAEAAAESPAAAGETAGARPQPRLNPTVDAEKAKAVPNVPAAPAAEEGTTGEEGGTADRGPVARAPRQEAIAIPPKNYELDAETEAEIAAALASGELPDAVAAPASAELKAEDAPPKNEDELQAGTKLKGKVQAVHGDNVILDLGYRASGCVPAKQFEGKLPEVGATIDVVVDKYDQGEGLIFCGLPKATRSVGNWSEVSVGQIVDCMVVKSNKGGLEVNISNLRGFLPAGQVDIGFVSDLEQFVGQKLRVKITEVNPQKRNLVVSRRAFLEIARSEAREELWKKLAVGQTYTGTVKTIKDYGAFVDIGGVDGLLHVGEMSWSRIGHPSELLKEGQQVDVQVLGIDTEKSKISLGMRQLQQNPWNDLESRYPPQTVVHGRVTKTTDFGAFVEIEPGVEGLIHISELDHRRVHRVTDVLRVGQEVDAQIVSVDPARKRIALSLKALTARPEPEVKKDEDLAPGGGTPYERKRKGPLKGGTAGGGGTGSFLFGSNPED